MALYPLIVRSERDNSSVSLYDRVRQLAEQLLHKPYSRLLGDQQRALILQAMADPRTRLPDIRPGRYVGGWDGPAERKLAS